MTIIKNKASLVFAGCLLFISACGTSNRPDEHPATESPSQNNQNVQSGLIESEGKKEAADFDSRTNIKVECGDYLLEVPASWEDENPYFYAEPDDHTTMLLFQSDALDFSITDENLVSGRDEYIGGVLKRLDDSELVDAQTITVNNIVMNGAVVNAVINGISGRLEFYWLANPSNNHLNQIMY